MIITSKDNSNVKKYIKLSTSKKERQQSNMFVVEGLRIVEDAAKEGWQIESLFISDSAAVRYSDDIEKIYKSEKSEIIFEISDIVADKMSDTKTTQGVFAIVRKLDKVFSVDKIISNGRYIILNNLQDPGNIGTIIRTADAVGIDGIIMSDDCCELYNSKLVRSTMGSIFRIKCFDMCNIDSVLKAMENLNIRTYAAVIDTDAVSLTECDFSNGAAVVIGNEGNGLPVELAEKCTNKLTIKMQGNINSLNAAMATGIIMWEMRK